MTQSRKHSVWEATVNTVLGFAISWAMWQFVVAPIFGYATTTHQSFWITVLFTATSWLRSYGVRRLAVWWQRRQAQRAMDELVEATERLGLYDWSLLDKEEHRVHHSKD